MFKFGLQIQGNSDNLEEALSIIQPRVVLVTGAYPGHNAEIIEQAKQILGDRTTYVYRSWTMEQPGDLDNYNTYRDHYGHDNIDPYFRAMDKVINRLGTDVLYYTFNEAVTGQDVYQWQQFVDWHVEAVNYANEQGIGLVTLNQSVGTPVGTDEDIRVAWELAEPLYKVIEHGKSVIGLHEYFPGKWQTGYGYYVGRYQYLTDYLDEKDYRVPIIITEFGTDDVNDPVIYQQCPAVQESGGWRSYAKCGMLGSNPEAGLVYQIKQTHEQVYDSDQYIVGTCYYVFNAFPGTRWTEYDINTPEIINGLRNETMATGCNPDLKVQVILGTYELLYDMRIRTAPVVDSCSYQGETMGAGEQIISVGYVDNGGYRWRKFYNSAGEVRYIAEYMVDGSYYLREIESLPSYTLITSDEKYKPMMQSIADVLENMDYHETG